MQRNIPRQTYEQERSTELRIWSLFARAINYASAQGDGKILKDNVLGMSAGMQSANNNLLILLVDLVLNAASFAVSAHVLCLITATSVGISEGGFAIVATKHLGMSKMTPVCCAK